MTFDSLAVTVRAVGFCLMFHAGNGFQLSRLERRLTGESVAEFSISRQFTRSLASSEPAAPQPRSENNRKTRFSEAGFGWSRASSCLPGYALEMKRLL